MRQMLMRQGPALIWQVNCETNRPNMAGEL